MTTISVIFFLTFLAFIKQSSGTQMSLSKIRYRFTNCGQGDRIGPTYEMCLEEYRNSSILALQPGNFFFYNTLQSTEFFIGAQGFTIPISGRYNVTVAGAAGGRGICNTHYGRGLLWNGQLDFAAGENVLISVGEKGGSPCEDKNLLGVGDLCLTIPQNETEAAVCNETWYSNIFQALNNPSLAEEVYRSTGGGGGGGASMIRLVNHTMEGPDPIRLPLVIAPGGGGSACVAVYSEINQIDAVFPTENMTDFEKYKDFMDAKMEFFDPADTSGIGTRGSVRDQSIFRGGAGGGYFTTRNSGDVDGGYLSAKENFAEGGSDCTRQLFDLVSSVDATDETGGFGGGGGQCGSGGGGGGFSGGRSSGQNHLMPGQGGYYYVVGTVSIDEQDDRNVQETSIGWNELDNGFVELVLANCGCTGLCKINDTQDTFECVCADNETVLAPNGFDCAEDTVLHFNASIETAVLIDDVTFTPLYLPHAVSLYAMSGAVSMENASSCCLVLFGADSKPALSTNVHTDSSNGTFDYLSMLYSDGSSYAQSSFYAYLPQAVMVTGGVLVSQGSCQLLTEQFNATVSTQNVSTISVSTDELLSNHNSSELLELAQTVLGLDESTEEPTTTNRGVLGDTPEEIVWSLVGICFLFLLTVISVVLIFVFCHVRKTARKHKEMILPRQSYLVNSANSMIPNTYYHAFGTPANDRFVPGHYVQACPPKRLDQNENDYEVISYSDLDIEDTTQQRNAENPITASARHFPTKFGVTAPVHDFTSYNRYREEDLGQLWEYPRGNLVYLRELGEGEFGKVLLMKAKGIANFQGEIPVAVKTLSCHAPNMLEKFVEEINLMKAFCHPNIVSLLGVSSHDVNEDSAPLMILEYMPYGDLRGFLRKNKPQNDKPDSLITPAHFFSIGRDVAEALSFLGSKGYVHRDIAARNCLVGPGLRIKIADFGLSRGVQMKSYYRVRGKTVLPVKWMAPESLLFGVFTSASDVWSFGVLLWEVVTYGEAPLEKETTEEIIAMAEKQSLTHKRPDDCPEEIFMVMDSCHQHKPEDRIKFDGILKNLSQSSIEDYFEATIELS